MTPPRNLEALRLARPVVHCCFLQLKIHCQWHWHDRRTPVLEPRQRCRPVPGGSEIRVGLRNVPGFCQVQSRSWPGVSRLPSHRAPAAVRDSERPGPQIPAARQPGSAPLRQPLPPAWVPCPSSGDSDCRSLKRSAPAFKLVRSGPARPGPTTWQPPPPARARGRASRPESGSPVDPGNPSLRQSESPT